MGTKSKKDYEKESKKNWEMKMNEPMKPTKLTEKEIEELKKSGRV